MFDDDFKKAVSNLPSKEKDRLLIRLLKKDINLSNRLYFELIDERSAEDRREELEERLDRKIESFTNKYYSPNYLKMDMNLLSGEISEHVRITKDKYGEASLNLLMLNGVLSRAKNKLNQAAYGSTYKLAIYITARVFKVLIIVNKMHPDVLIDFKNDFENLGNLMAENENIMRVAVQNGLDINWLLNSEIPEDIVEIQKDLRAKGFLR